MTSWNKWILAGSLLFLAACVATTYCNWTLLHGDAESPAETIRNVGLLVGGTIALVIAWWRGIINTEQERTAKRVLANDRYQKAVELLANNASPVRRAGLFALLNLAQEHPEEYARTVLDLCNDLAVDGGAMDLDTAERVVLGDIVDILETTVRNLD